MNSTKARKSKYGLLSYPIIVAASSGEVDAINTVLKHYEGYIVTLSTRTLYDDYGNPRLLLDEEMRRELETRLITRIMAFITF